MEFEMCVLIFVGIIALVDGIRNNGTLAVGCTVAIDGLTKSPALNGKGATVLQRIKMKDASIEAYEVKVVETGEQGNLKRTNLKGGRNIGALMHLDISGNSLGHLVPPEGWEAHGNGTHYRRHGGTWSTTVPAGSQPVGIITIANAIPDMGAMSKLTFGVKKVVTMTTEMTEANFSGELKCYEILIVAAFLPKCT
jgi:hypothetical protein